ASMARRPSSSTADATTPATSTRISSLRLTPNWRPGRTAQAPRADFVLGADHVEFDVHVVTRRVGVGADLLVRLLDQLGELGLRQALVLDAHLHGKPETAAIARPDRHGAGDLGLGGVLLVLLGNEINRSAETGSVAGGEKVLRRRRARLARATHLLRHR